MLSADNACRRRMRVAETGSLGVGKV